MIKTTLRQKLFLFIFSIFLVLIILEFFLRLSGFLYLSFQERDNKELLKQKDTIRIMCIGESTTALGGKDSYPTQLQEILNDRVENKKYVVINKGIPGIDSNTIITNLSEWIQQYNPNIVVVMMGINNHNSFVVSKETNNKIEMLFKKTKIYKVYHFIKITLLGNKRELIQNLDSVVSTKNISKEKHPPSFYENVKSMSKVYMYGVALQKQKKYTEAIVVFNKILKQDIPDSNRTTVSHRLSEIYSENKNWVGLLRVASQLISYNPYATESSRSASKLCRQAEVRSDAIKMLHDIDQRNIDHPVIKSLLSYCYDLDDQKQRSNNYANQARKVRLELVNLEVREHYNEVINMLDKNDVLGIYMQYATRAVQPLKNMLKDSKNFNQLIFVDSQKAFKEAFTKGFYEDYFYDRFAGDFGHCTRKGNKILADNLSKTIISLTK
ncbi:MAG: tetratricopeptide (TPR) repeat protein [Lysobacterales bacterium]|jgi:tetratricopeptide (TPR) repeat protein